MMVGGELLANNEEDFIMTTCVQQRVIEHEIQFQEQCKRIYDIGW